MFRVNIITLLILFRCVFGIIGIGEDLYGKCSESEYCARITSCRSYKTDQIKQCGGDPSHRIICCPKVPLRKDCGFPVTYDKVIGGSATRIDEFPWMAVLEYRIFNTTITDIRCGGSLINQRYILTAAHCLIENSKSELWRIRLGEYHLTNATDYVGNITADPIVTVDFEDIIIHPNYHQRSLLNDIALIRLSKDIEYNDFIQPVCLPSTLGIVSPSVGSNLVISGWGETKTDDQSLIKQKLEVPVNNFTRCEDKFGHRGLNEATQICAGGRDEEDSCRGDSGGPIMRKFQLRYVIEGVTSFGKKNGCGVKYWPAVYTRVSSFEPWIFENIRP